MGEKSLRSILEMAEKVADGSLPMDSEHLRRIAGKYYYAPTYLPHSQLFLHTGTGTYCSAADPVGSGFKSPGWIRIRIRNPDPDPASEIEL